MIFSKNLVSCSDDSSIIFYLKDNNKYKKDYQFLTGNRCYSIIQTKDNEMVYSEYNKSQISFFDILERRKKTSIPNISKRNDVFEMIIMIRKDLLLIPGNNKISIINTNEYKLVRTIEVPGACWIYGVCMLNKNMLLTGDFSEVIRQWKIEGDNLILISKKQKTHDNDIRVLCNMGNGLIASGSSDKTIKIW